MANLFKIKEIARAKKISIKNLAENVGITEQGLQKLIRDNSTKVETLESIAKCLTVPVYTFFDEQVEMSNIDYKDKYYSELEKSSSLKDTVIELTNKLSELEKKIAVPVSAAKTATEKTGTQG